MGMRENGAGLRIDILRKINPEGIPGYRITLEGIYLLFPEIGQDRSRFHIAMQFLIDEGLVGVEHEKLSDKGEMLPKTFGITHAGMVLRR